MPKWVGHYMGGDRSGVEQKVCMVNATDLNEARRKFLTYLNLTPRDLEVDSWEEAWQVATSGEDEIELSYYIDSDTDDTITILNRDY